MKRVNNEIVLARDKQNGLTNPGAFGIVVSTEFLALTTPSLERRDCKL